MPTKDPWHGVPLSPENLSREDLLRGVAGVLPPVPIPEREVLRRMGYPAGITRAETGMESMLGETFEKAGALLRFRAALRECVILENTGSEIRFESTDFILKSGQVCRMLRSARSAVFFMCTIGGGLEHEIQRCMDAGDATEAFILDAVGSETADAAVDWVHWTMLEGMARSRQQTVTPRFSPGYGDWPLAVQRDIFELCDGRRIGVTLTESSLMLPRKSVSAVLGLKPAS